MVYPRALALIAAGRHGGAAVSEARRLGLAGQIEELTVVALAPQASGPRCGTSILDYNAAVTEAAREELACARAILTGLSTPTHYTLLADRDEDALVAFAATGAFDLVLLPGRRGRRHSQSRRLRTGTRAEVRVVAGVPQPASA